MLILLWLVLTLAALAAGLYTNAPGVVLTATLAVAFGVAWAAALLPMGLLATLGIALAVVALILHIVPLRRVLVSNRVLAGFRKVTIG